MNYVLYFICSLIGSLAGAILAFFTFAYLTSRRALKPNSIVEETEDHKLEFDEDSKSIIDYCIKKNLNVVIQPNYNNEMWIFHVDDDGQYYGICEMAPGTLVNMTNKINSYIVHKKDRQDQLKEGQSNETE